jgi:hypothetical protein
MEFPMSMRFPWFDRVDCRVGFQGNPSRNDRAMDGRMTDKATKKGGAPRALAQMGASQKGPSQASGAQGFAWRGRQPEPTRSFTKSPPQFPPLSSRGHPLVAIHCEPVTEGRAC